MLNPNMALLKTDRALLRSDSCTAIRGMLSPDNIDSERVFITANQAQGVRMRSANSGAIC
jgi:hypothetical protein